MFSPAISPKPEASANEDGPRRATVDATGAAERGVQVSP